jgi:hypothetical protein
MTRFRICGDEPNGAGMTEQQIFDDDARLEQDPAVVDEHREFLQRPVFFEFAHRRRVFGPEPAVDEGRVVLVERDKDFLAIGSKGMCVQRWLHVYLRFCAKIHALGARRDNLQSID